MTAAIYFFVGFIGGLTCAPSVAEILNESTQNNYSTIFDCFQKTGLAEDIVFYWIGKLVQIAILLQNFSVLPILFFLTRK